MAELSEEIQSINVDLSCDGDCAGCEKYFRCTLPQKDNLMVGGRMGQIREVISKIKHKIMSVGGKGGVGKTLVAVNLAMGLAMKGKKVAVLDQVFDGPCVPQMLGVEGKGMGYTPEGLLPCEGPLGIQVVSMGLIVPEDESITWFHAMKRNATEEMLSNVLYGEQDYLVIDVPAGTSSDTVNIVQCIPEMDGATVVTVPSEVSQAVAYKAIMLLKEAKVPVLGVFENMATFTCSHCGEKIDILQSGGGKKLAKRCGVPFLGSIPFDSRVAECGDEGIPVIYKYPDSEAAQIFKAAIDKIEERLK